MSRSSTKIGHRLAQLGVASRRASEELVRKGRVSVNGILETNPATRVYPEDTIALDGEFLYSKNEHIYIALNKPSGYLSSFNKSAEEGRLLGELIQSDQRIFPAGRLDRESRGLLILSSDGHWANRVMHPRYEKEKEYRVRFEGVAPRLAAPLISSASYQEDQIIYKAAKVWAEKDSVVVILSEGRKRQIRNLAKVAGLVVIDLLRVRVGEVELGDLKEGENRPLLEAEIKSFLD